jgi:hypothetical protein
MKILTLCLLLTLAAQTLCRAEITRLPADTRKALQDTSRFQQILKVADLPPGIVALCTYNTGMADPGKEWEAGDLNPKENLPGRCLIWAATDKDYYVVHYESGGVSGPRCHLLIARLKPGDKNPTFIWHAIGGRLKDLNAALDAIANNQLKDDPRIHR